MQRAERSVDLVFAQSRRDRLGAPIDEAYLAAVFNALVYLASYTHYAPSPSLSEMAERAAAERAAKAKDPRLECPTDDDLKAYVLGYAYPLMHAGVWSSIVQEAAARYVKHHSDYPKSPAPLIKFAEAAMRDYEPVSNGRLCLPRDTSGDVSLETRNERRRRFGLPEVPA